MLHDASRNSKYDGAITVAVRDFQARFHRRPIVLDVGTGTGLLADVSVYAVVGLAQLCVLSLGHMNMAVGRMGWVLDCVRRAYARAMA